MSSLPPVPSSIPANEPTPGPHLSTGSIPQRPAAPPPPIPGRDASSPAGREAAMTSKRETPLLRAALDYAMRGWRVLPLHDVVSGRCSCRQDKCKSPGKHPRTRRGVKEASLEEPQIRQWWSSWPSANIGIACGSASGNLVVLDVDPRNQGTAALGGLTANHGSLPETPEVRTGGDGVHYYFQAEDIRSSHGKVAPGIDIQADGAYVVAPPSLHPSGETYAWFVHPDERALAPAPRWIGESSARPTPKRTPPRLVQAPSAACQDDWRMPSEEELEELARTFVALDVIPSESRDTWLRVGMALHGTKYPMAREMWDAWSEGCVEKYDEEDQSRTWRSFGDRGRGAVTLGTVFHLGGEHGMDPSSPPRSVFEFVDLVFERCSSIAPRPPAPPAPSLPPRSAGTRIPPAAPPAPGPQGVRADAETEDLLQAFVPFPMSALPEPLRSFVEEGSEVLGCDTAFLAAPVLAACAGAIGLSRCIRLKSGWTEPAVIWAAIVGESGTLKSPACDLATHPLSEAEAASVREFSRSREQYEAATQRYDKEYAAWKRSKEDTAPPERPKEPKCHRRMVSDITVEALASRLEDNPRGVIVVRDELDGWIRSFGEYKGGNGGDVAKWLELHRAGTLLVDRKGRADPLLVERAAVSIVGGIQPGVLLRALAGENTENGLAARLLIAAPPRRPRTWRDRELSSATRQAYSSIIDHLLALTPNLAAQEGVDVSWRPTEIGLSPPALEIFSEFVNSHGKEQVDLEGPLAAAWSKLEGYAARLALVIHLVRQASNERLVENEIDARSIEAGIVIARWFADGARQMCARAAEDEQQALQRDLVELIRSRGGSISPRELCRARRKCQPTKNARECLLSLAKAGLGRLVQHAPGPRGGRPSERFILHGSPTAAPPTPGIAPRQTSPSPQPPGPFSSEQVDETRLVAPPPSFGSVNGACGRDVGESITEAATVHLRRDPDPADDANTQLVVPSQGSVNEAGSGAPEAGCAR